MRAIRKGQTKWSAAEGGLRKARAPGNLGGENRKKVLNLEAGKKAVFPLTEEKARGRRWGKRGGEALSKNPRETEEVHRKKID